MVTFLLPVPNQRATIEATSASVFHNPHCLQTEYWQRTANTAKREKPCENTSGSFSVLKFNPEHLKLLRTGKKDTHVSHTPVNKRTKKMETNLF